MKILSSAIITALLLSNAPTLPMFQGGSNNNQTNNGMINWYAGNSEQPPTRRKPGRPRKWISPNMNQISSHASSSSSNVLPSVETNNPNGVAAIDLSKEQNLSSEPNLSLAIKELKIRASLELTEEIIRAQAQKKLSLHTILNKQNAEIIDPQNFTFPQ